MNAVKITWLSNIVWEPCLSVCLKEAFSASNLEVELKYTSYEDYGGESAYLTGTAFYVIALNFEYMYQDVVNDIASGKITGDVILSDVTARCTALYNTVRSHSMAPIIWFGFEDYCYGLDAVLGTVPIMGCLVEKINLLLSQILHAGDAYIDLGRLIAKGGTANSFDNKGKYRWNAPYSEGLIRSAAKEIYKFYLIHMGRTRKCLVLDCDNVLWGGVVSEDGVSGIRLGNSGLGRPYQDFQRFLLTLYYHGVILAVCSKNDEEDVLRIFREHSGMLLKEEHISCFRINWAPKPDNIRTIAQSLNIGLDSIVFVDDSIHEISAVKAMLPEVIAIQYDRNAIYEELSCFNLKAEYSMESIRKRTETYRTNEKRKLLEKSSASFEEYLSALGTKIDIHETLSIESARIAELTQRTNKCTNGTRYSIGQIEEKLKAGNYSLYTVSVSDRFSDLGIVGVIGICGEVLDLFSLSCRALGRKVEDQMLDFAEAVGFRKFIFHDTGRNSGLRRVLELLLKIENC